MISNSLIGRIRFVPQPTATTCGQACVAMLTGETVEQVCARLGKSGSTGRLDLVRALHESGRVRVWPKWVDPASLREFVPCALVFEPAPEGEQLGHWLLWVGDAYLDPVLGEVDAAAMWERWGSRDTRPRDMLIVEVLP